MTSRLPRNQVRVALEERGSALGTWVQMNSPEACQAAGHTGFDFVVVDMQHGSLGLTEAATLMAAVASTGASPFVRMPDGTPTEVGRLLDAGAHGLVVPDVKSAAHIEAVVAAATYPQAGTRGSCPTTIASRHGVVGWEEYRAWADEEICVWALIEHPDAIAEIEAIARSGVHALMLGPFDLSLAMGHNGQVDHPEVEAALTRAVEAAKGAGIECVAVLFDPADQVTESGRRWQERGCRILTGSSDRWALTQGWATTLEGLQRV